MGKGVLFNGTICLWADITGADVQITTQTRQMPDTNQYKEVNYYVHVYKRKLTQ